MEIWLEDAWGVVAGLIFTRVEAETNINRPFRNGQVADFSELYSSHDVDFLEVDSEAGLVQLSEAPGHGQVSKLLLIVIVIVIHLGFEISAMVIIKQFFIQIPGPALLRYRGEVLANLWNVLEALQGTWQKGLGELQGWTQSLGVYVCLGC